MTNEEIAAEESNQAETNQPEETSASEGSRLPREQLDTIREMTTIALGAASSNLGVILNTEAEIPTIEVKEHATLSAFQEPFEGTEKLAATMRFSGGTQYNTAFILKTNDAKTIASMMLGGDKTEEGPLNELQSSAVSEAFSQMMNASATSLASVLSAGVDVTAPEIENYSADILKSSVTNNADTPVISIHFTLYLGDGQSFEMVQLMKIDEALEQVDKLMSQEAGADEPNESEESQEAAQATPNSPSSAAGPSAPTPPPQGQDPVTVQPVQFAAFDQQPDVYGEYNKNLDLVLDVTLNLTVQLGTTELSIKQILELTRGSVIELNRIAGEPVDLLANGKLIAKGEVVVIEDNFGLRITSIVSPEDRLRGLTG